MPMGGSHVVGGINDAGDRPALAGGSSWFDNSIFTGSVQGDMLLDDGMWEDATATSFID